MLPYIRIAAMVRNARSSFASGNYLDAINYATSLLSLLGFESEAAKISALIKDVQNGDAEDIAYSVLALAHDLVKLVFSGGKPATTGVATLDLCEQYDALAAECDRLTTPTVGAAADTGAIDPATVLVIVQVAQQVFAFFWDRYQKKQQAAA